MLQKLAGSPSTRWVGLYGIWCWVKEIHDVDLLVESGDAVALATLAAPPDARVTPHDRFGTVQLRGRIGEYRYLGSSA